MYVAQVKIENFRGIKHARIGLGATALLLGDNNSGKSTVLEAIELALGPDRLYRRPPIDEHDFHAGKYLDEAISIEVTLAGLSEEIQSRFRANLEYWDMLANAVLESAPAGEPEFCIRILFTGRYDPEEDDFVGETWFAVPLREASEPSQRCTSTDKRAFGFLLLRALRTGNRAMSMERGSLLDVVLRAFEVEVQMWEQLLDKLRTVPVAGEDNDQFGAVLTSLDTAMKKIVTSEWADAPHLRVSDLTREDLRHVLRAFMATGTGDYAAPFNHQGSGTINSLVIAMLSLIAERRDKAVIFAMEEPEISLPPTAQKRIVDLIRDIAGQSIFTSHSPYVLEEFEPEQLVVVSRDLASGEMAGAKVDLPPELKHKVFMQGMRTRFSEALLARRIIVCEGRSEALAYPYLAKRGAAAAPDDYSRMDTDGWAVFDAEGETNVASFARFFKGLGKGVITIFDTQPADRLAAIYAASDVAFEQPYAGFEDLLVAEVPMTAKRAFVEDLQREGGWPGHVSGPADDTDEALDKALSALFKKTKGEGVAMHLLSTLDSADYPATMRSVLDGIRNFTRAEAPASEGLVDGDQQPEGEAVDPQQ
ncbi:ATP-dependent endonuclease [Pseudoclavibacter sp. AY1H1]|uniref:ATP-dependent nuclease n=1 Tax=Pseudoclavibacter sp. AY1H1 TaxID=2080584 RepID=UPI000CE79C8E|nr:AAA family ATPase [Pseudoclavibacter sp. AY1H1]PPF34955.1 ATP-dependent endonuclease [Pseudoclavibacter sp. AY1H1]